MYVFPETWRIRRSPRCGRPSSAVPGGIQYFNHNFYAQDALELPTRRVLIEPAYARTTAAFKQVNVMAQHHNGRFYVFAATAQVSQQRVTFTLKLLDGATAVVPDEGRSLPVTGGRFSDTFRGGTGVHVYRIDRMVP